ncbi:MAG TPA: helix-turn-helix transcriptional regulator [Arenimonas sp.]|uniref:helix-turn-helix domain-containing protein n=1 Tax=Arenimonas sp. TaxID=1872635 RepID=UPI002D7E2688|nr:helix-turn-helix transcriptional regulator [Arenimonas sp.]HEU0152846.1 helix-turn-helix transcriptional regulator [Arenimonas sp.]
MNGLAERIRRCRKDARLSQAQLAERLGLGRSAVAQWERDTAVRPTVGHMTEIALATGVSFEWLATGRGARVIGGEGEEAPAFVLDYVAQSETEERLLLAFRRLDALAQLSLVEKVEALAADTD